MRTVVALVGFVVVMFAAIPARADRSERVLDVVDALQLNDATMNKLMPAYATYEKERGALLDKQVALLQDIQLNTDVAPPAHTDKLLDDYLALQRAIVATETKFVAKLRKLLKPEQAKIARVMLLSPFQITPPAPAAAPSDPYAPPPRNQSPKREDDLFPPGSQLANAPRPPPRPCDPFAAMHGCSR